MKGLLKGLGIFFWLISCGSCIQAWELRHLIPGFQGYLVSRNFGEVPDLYVGIILAVVGIVCFTFAAGMDKSQEEKQIDEIDDTLDKF
jgi:hypothetical protein|tara:strand:- start:228 stop:491 length:264 start_codon:yes stop_codon:yes gene_type:complete